MTPVELTSVAAVIVTIVASIIVPAVLRRRRAQETESAAEVVSWRGINEVLKKDRDELRIELDGIRKKHRDELAALDADYTGQLDTQRSQIRRLERMVEEQAQTINGLYAQIGQLRQLPPA